MKVVECDGPVSSISGVINMTSPDFDPKVTDQAIAAIKAEPHPLWWQTHVDPFVATQEFSDMMAEWAERDHREQELELDLALEKKIANEEPEVIKHERIPIWVIADWTAYDGIF